MKKLISFIVLFTSFYGNSQEFKLDSKTVTGIFEVKDKTKSQMFSSINKWISINYNSAKNVVQMSDAESGTFIIKGINEVSYKNTYKIVQPNNKNVPEMLTTKFNHLVEINIKENKFRIVFTITSLTQDDLGTNDLFFNCVNFTSLDDNSVNAYADKLDEFMKQGMVGKEKREKYRASIKPMLEEMNMNLIENIKKVMLSINKSVSEDGW